MCVFIFVEEFCLILLSSFRLCKYVPIKPGSAFDGKLFIATMETHGQNTLEWAVLKLKLLRFNNNQIKLIFYKGLLKQYVTKFGPFPSQYPILK